MLNWAGLFELGCFIHRPTSATDWVFVEELSRKHDLLGGRIAIMV